MVLSELLRKCKFFNNGEKCFLFNVYTVNNSLPIHLTASNVQQNPEFVKLLMSLTRHLTDSGMSVAVHKDMLQVRNGPGTASLNAFVFKAVSAVSLYLKLMMMNGCQYRSIHLFKQRKYYPTSPYWNK